MIISIKNELNKKADRYSSESILKSHIFENNILKENLKKLDNDYNLKYYTTNASGASINETYITNINNTILK